MTNELCMGDTRINRAKQTRSGIVLTLLMFTTVILNVIISAGLDSDTWLILNNGRYIVSNGIPETNPFTIHSNLPVVLSQPLTAVMEYGMYRLLGEKGLCMWVVLFVLLSIFITYKLSRSVTDSVSHNISRFVSCTIVMLFSAGAFCHFWSNRPQLLTISLLAWELIILEKYGQNETKYKSIVFGLPLISFLLANVHGSFYMFVYLPIIAYIVAWIVQKIFSVTDVTKNKNWLPIRHVLIATCCMLVTGMVNPYGLRGNLYLINSIGAATKYHIIQELAAPGLVSLQTAFFLFEVAAGGIHITKQWKKYTLNFYHILLWLGGNLTYLFAIRNLWIAALFSIPLIAQALISWNLMETIWTGFQQLCSKKYWKVLMTVIVFGTMLYNMVIWDDNWSVNDSHTTPVLAIQYIDEHTSEKQREKIYTSFNNGAYVEWCGYKTYIDARPELYEQKGNSIYSEFVSVYYSMENPCDFLKKYDFDYLILYDDTSASEALLRYYVCNDNNWECVVHGNGYMMFKSTIQN